MHAYLHGLIFYCINFALQFKNSNARDRMTKKKKPEDLKKVGRPTKFTPEKLNYMRYLFETGSTDKVIAREIGVTERTLHNWKRDNPEFFHSLKDWKLHADKVIENTLYARAKGMTIKETKVFFDKDSGEIIKEEIDKELPPDTTSMIFWLKNRKPNEYRDKHEVELGKDTIKSFGFKLDEDPDEVDKPKSDQLSDL